MKKYLLSVLGLCVTILSFADVKLPQIFSNNMVLQRNILLPIWGWAAPGEKVTVQFNKQSKSVKAGKDGKWTLQLNKEAAGGPFTLTVKGKNTITVSNVLVGEVWICSGQSNMEMQVGQSADRRYDTVIREANDSLIRHFKVKKVMSDTAVWDVSGEWKIANDSNNLREFSSVGYFFAKKLEEELHVPIGLINSSWGGTIVETWISPETFAKFEEFKGVVKKTYPEAKAKSEWPDNPNVWPSLLYNAMINPLIPYAIKGTIWYQGESNADRAKQYSKSFPLMIADWRSHWKQGDFPFYFVQLASWKASDGNSNKGSSWAELRESQTSSLSVPNTGMAVALDLGDYENIHPSDKKDVGLRLAAVALNKDYGKSGEYTGPMFDKMDVKGNMAEVSFKHSDGLVVKDNYGYVKGFEVAGADKKFYYAKAAIKDGKVQVWSDSVAAPVAVRYGWADYMPDANLYNQAGFPAVSFRTDTWNTITENNKFKVE